MSHRIIGAVVIKQGQPPAPRPFKGRPQRWAQVYRAIETMKPGEWFKVPDPSNELKDEKERYKAKCSIQKWIDAHDLRDSVQVYESLDGVCVVAPRQAEVAVA